MLCLFLLAISRKLLCQEECPGSSVSTSSIENPGEIYIPVGSTKHFRCVSLDSMATVVWNVILRSDSVRLGTENDIRLNENGVSIEPYITMSVYSL